MHLCVLIFVVQSPRFTPVCDSWNMHARVIRNFIMLFVSFHGVSMSTMFLQVIASLRLPLLYHIRQLI